MTHFFKTIIRGFQNTSIHHFNSKSSFLGNVVSTFIEDSPEVQPTSKPSKIYFDAPLAGDMSCFNKTDDDFLPGKAEEKESPVIPVSIPFMVIISIFPLMEVFCFLNIY